MSATAPTLEETIKSAIESIITALANIAKGVADALSSYAGLIATVVVMIGLGYLAWRGIERVLPFIRGILGRLF
jgi:phage-related protein